MQKRGSRGLEIDPAQDYNYDYRQGIFADPFGHHWGVKKRLVNFNFTQ
jgi:PhnB protein